MKPAIICLPITIPADVKPGLALTPFTVWTVSKLLALSSVCSINLTGMKYAGMGSNEVTGRFTTFKKIMDRLGMRFDSYWLDNEQSHVKSLQGYCDELASSHCLRSEHLEILSCDCGAVEILKDAVSSKWATERKLIKDVDGQLQCRLCHSILKSDASQVLVLNSGFNGNPITAFPTFYQKEVDSLQAEYNQPVLVSRKRKLGNKVWLFGREWTLDTDFCWSFLFRSLQKAGFDSEVVVISNRSIKPLVLSYGISRKTGANIKPISAIVTPFATIKGGLASTSHQITIPSLVDRYGATPVRFLLGDCLKWEQKDLVVDSSIIFWTMKALEKAADYTETAAKVVSIREALSMSDGNSIASFITGMRRSEKVSLTPYQKLLLGKDT
ncbi:MAG: hypothetical protein KGI66_03040 [Patescibacteria group bacterium]|nr:hypothetical protein [Patescibacteria group bacterium]